MANDEEFTTRVVESLLKQRQNNGLRSANGFLRHGSPIPMTAKELPEVVAKFAGKTKALKLEELKYSLLDGTDAVRFDARVSFFLTIEEMEATTLKKLIDLLDATMVQITQETETAKAKRPVKRTIIID